MSERDETVDLAGQTRATVFSGGRLSASQVNGDDAFKVLTRIVLLIRDSGEVEVEASANLHELLMYGTSNYEILDTGDEWSMCIKGKKSGGGEDNPSPAPPPSAVDLVEGERDGWVHWKRKGAWRAVIEGHIEPEDKP